MTNVTKMIALALVVYGQAEMAGAQAALAAKTRVAPLQMEVRGAQQGAARQASTIDAAQMRVRLAKIASVVRGFNLGVSSKLVTAVSSGTAAEAVAAQQLLLVLEKSAANRNDAAARNKADQVAAQLTKGKGVSLAKVAAAVGVVAAAGMVAANDNVATQSFGHYSKHRSCDRPCQLADENLLAIQNGTDAVAAANAKAIRDTAQVEFIYSCKGTGGSTANDDSSCDAVAAQKLGAKKNGVDEEEFQAACAVPQAQ